MSPPIDVWVVFRDSQRVQTSEIRAQLRRASRERQWTLQERVSRIVQTTTAGRTRSLLEARDADALYRRLHRSWVAVLSFEETFVSVDPRDPRPRIDRKILRLEELVRYKSFSWRTDPARWVLEDFVEAFDEWRAGTNCEGEHDPRCLPLHIFATTRADLASEVGRSAFSALHGPASGRIDRCGNRWRTPGRDVHGREVLAVAGHALRSGFHWDVSPERGAAKLSGLTEIWAVRDYVNIAPDGHFRGRHPHARKEFP